MPLWLFHARIINNKQDCCIMKTTMEPLLEQAAAHIAVVVEAKRPANRPTRKGLIHNNVDKTTEELRRRVQSLEAKLGKDSVKKVKAAKTRMDNDKKRSWGLPSPHPL